MLNKMSDKERKEFENGKSLKPSMTVEKYEKQFEGFLDEPCESHTDHRLTEKYMHQLSDLDWNIKVNIKEGKEKKEATISFDFQEEHQLQAIIDSIKNSELISKDPITPEEKFILACDLIREYIATKETIYEAGRLLNLASKERYPAAKRQLDELASDKEILLFCS